MTFKQELARLLPGEKLQIGACDRTHAISIERTRPMPNSNGLLTTTMYVSREALESEYGDALFGEVIARTRIALEHSRR